MTPGTVGNCGARLASRGVRPLVRRRRHRPPSRPTGATWRHSSPGPSGSGSRRRATCSARRSGATWPSSPPGGSPAAPSPGGPRHFVATSAGCAARWRDHHRSDGWPQRAQGRGPAATGPAPRRTARPARRAGSGGPDGARDLRDTALLELLYGSGLRVAEAAALDIDDLDLAQRRVRVWGKGGKQRLVPLSEPAVDALRRWLADGRRELATEASPAAAVFLNRRGRRLTPRDARRCWIGERPRRRIPMHCGTPLPPTCSTGAPTCGSSRSCSAMQTWRPRSDTLTSPRNGYGPCSTPPTHGLRGARDVR